MGLDESGQLNIGGTSNVQLPTSNVELGESVDASGVMPAGWTAEQLQMFPDLQFEAMSDEQLGLGLDLPEGDPLSLQESVFVQAYCFGSSGEFGGKPFGSFNGTASARLAGYPHPHVAQNRLRQRPRIKKAVSAALSEVLSDGRASREALVLKLARIVHGDLGELARALPDPEHVTLADLAMLPPDVAASLRKIKVHTVERVKRGGVTESENFVDIELHDPKSAAELIAKIEGMVTDKVRHEGAVSVTFTDEDKLEDEGS